MEQCGNYNRNMNNRCGCGSNMMPRRANNDFSANRYKMEKAQEKNMDMHRHENMDMHRHDMPVGIAYVPMQVFGEMYDACKGLKEGTMFPDLNLIFCGVRGN